MIDPHVHLRDWNQSEKETVKHGISVANKAGLSGVFEMPNTNPVLTSKEKIIERIELANKAILELGLMDKFFHGVYAGLTCDFEQIKDVVDAYNELFPRVVGLKMFAGNSTGNMGLVSKEEQLKVYEALTKLNYVGVIAVHCEKEDLMNPELWNPENPSSHSFARPEIAEIESVKDQIELIEKSGFKGKLHICHVSSPKVLDLIKGIKNVSCGLTPHHAILNSMMMEGKEGLLLKMNPPLRTIDSADLMLNALIEGKIDWIETDHAPHLKSEKINSPYASGIPGLPFYPKFIKILREKGLSDERIKDLTHGNIEKVFGFNIEDLEKTISYTLQSEYEFDAFEKI